MISTEMVRNQSVRLNDERILGSMYVYMPSRRSARNGMRVSSFTFQYGSRVKKAVENLSEAVV